MAYQLEIIRFRDAIPVLSIPRFIPNTAYPTIELKGVDFTSAQEVSINSVKVPEFMIVDKNTIYAQLPQGSMVISTVEVISSKFTRSELSSQMAFQIGDQTRKVSGLLKLVQLFTMWILQTPGSDIFNPTRGGGLQEIAGKVVTTRNMQPIYGVITRAINTTVSQIKTAQSNIGDLPLDERLLSADLVDMNIFEDRMEARARISLQSIAGVDAMTSLPL